MNQGAIGPRRVLVIKLGALGDFVQAMGPAAAIRAHHAEAEVTLLTSAPFAALGAAAPYFDRVWIDERPGLMRPWALWQLRRRLRNRFSSVETTRIVWNNVPPAFAYICRR